MFFSFGMHLAMFLPIPTAQSLLIQSQTSRPPWTPLQKMVNTGIYFQMPGQKCFKRFFAIPFIFTPPSTV